MTVQQTEINSSHTEHMKSQHHQQTKLFASTYHNGVSSKKSVNHLQNSVKKTLNLNHESSIDCEFSRNNGSQLKMDSFNSLLASSSTNLKPSKIPIYNSQNMEKFKSSSQNQSVNGGGNKATKNYISNNNRLLDQSLMSYSMAGSQNGVINNTNAGNNLSNYQTAVKLEKQDTFAEIQQSISNKKALRKTSNYFF